jgi:hypothetical protein
MEDLPVNLSVRSIYAFDVVLRAASWRLVFILPRGEGEFARGILFVGIRLGTAKKFLAMLVKRR